jgi:hypothetical protein
MADVERPADTPSQGGADEWPRGWAEHKRRQLRAFLASTPAQRLAWLEEMIELAHRAGALPRRRDGAAGGEP